MAHIRTIVNFVDKKIKELRCPHIFVVCPQCQYIHLPFRFMRTRNLETHFGSSALLGVMDSSLWYMFINSIKISILNNYALMFNAKISLFFLLLINVRKKYHWPLSTLQYLGIYSLLNCITSIFNTNQKFMLFKKQLESTTGFMIWAKVEVIAHSNQ